MTKRFRMADVGSVVLRFAAAEIIHPKYYFNFQVRVFVLHTSYSFGSVLYAEDARELFSSVVFCPIIRSFPWFSAESVHRESDVL